MTDTERKRIDAICEVAGVKEIDDLSDGFHTFQQLYYQRMMLFATIVKQNKNKAWKSLRHEDGELCFGGGWFIVGIDTPEGSYTYHYEDNYFSLFDCVELERSKHWDGHTEKDVTRLLSLESSCSEIPNSSDCIDRAEAQTAIQFAARRYTVAHEAHGEGHVVWSDNLISVTDAMNALREVPPAQPQSSQGLADSSQGLVNDTISRQATITEIKNYERDSTAPIDYVKIVEQMPPAQPSNGACWGCQCEKMEKPQLERNTGYIDIRVISMVDGEDCFCSECGAYCLSTAYKFCPKCGIKFIGVRGEQDE